MFVDSGRVNDPLTISESEIAAELAKRGRLVIQFARPNAYPPQVLRQLNSLCRQWSDSLEIRFYGHYGASFDAATLRYLPDVANLSVDCLMSIHNEDEIAQLLRLTHLRFGVFEFDHPAFLGTLGLERIKTLSLSENRKRNFDLSPLAACKSLEALYVEGHWKGIEDIAGLPCLKRVTLRAFAKTRSVAFLGKANHLSHLALVLGGREDITELASQSLQTLQILRVKGLHSFGDLSRFPTLRHLRIEDQLQLKRLDLTGAHLERLTLSNCKNLATIVGLGDQDQMREFVASRVALNLDELKELTWPKTMEVVGLYSGSNKWNESTAQLLANRGYKRFGSNWL